MRRYETNWDINEMINFLTTDETTWDDMRLQAYHTFTFHLRGSYRYISAKSHKSPKKWLEKTPLRGRIFSAKFL